MNVVTARSLKAPGNRTCHHHHYQYPGQSTLRAKPKVLWRVTVRMKQKPGTRQLARIVINESLQAQWTSGTPLISIGNKYKARASQQPGYLRITIIQIYLPSGLHWSWKVKRSILPFMALDMPCMRKKKTETIHHATGFIYSAALSRFQLFVTLGTAWSIPSFPVLHHLRGLAQTHVHWVGDTIQLSCPLSSPSPPAFNLSQHEDLS